MRKQWVMTAAALCMAGALAGCSSTQKNTSGMEKGAAVQTETSPESGDIAGKETAEEEDAEDEKKVLRKKAERTELTVFAAASLTETLTQIADMYKEVNPNVDIIYTFDSSGTLKTQIQEGAVCDIFISAAQKQMDQLDISADSSVNTENLDFILQESRFDLVENKVVLAVPDGNPAGIESYEDLGSDKLNLICLGNGDVPVGAYSMEILTSLGILDQLEADSKITYGSNVKEVTTQVKEASADCGIIYATDAFSAGLTVVDEAREGQCRQVIYPAAVLNTSKNQEAAQEFLDYLRTEDCAAVFENVGFRMVR